ncbi:hypothetical protein AB833_31540 [Chromatiales bacterium (ex Bugula neritina AB1)]|nr:hypothetical protein AB833_31540 [Chromatiales bacterium (ex Bugula neritina AB1)]
MDKVKNGQVITMKMHIFIVQICMDYPELAIVQTNIVNDLNNPVNRLQFFNDFFSTTCVSDIF